jgi:hypothetical protein
VKFGQVIVFQAENVTKFNTLSRINLQIKVVEMEIGHNV